MAITKFYAHVGTEIYSPNATDKYPMSNLYEIELGSGLTISDSGVDCGVLQATGTTQVLTTTERDALTSPTAGQIIFNSTTSKLNFYNGTAWEAVTSA